VPLRGSDDWAFLLGRAPVGAAPVTDSAGSGMPSLGERELDLDTARQRHVLFAVRPASFEILTTCPGAPKSVPASRDGAFSVALLATDDFDVNEVDLSSLRFHQARPVGTVVRDVNGDGRPDLLIEFRGSDVQLAKKATRARLTGWLNNSQIFIAEDEIQVCSGGQAGSSVRP